MNKRNCRILVAGSINIDLLMMVDRCPNDGENLIGRDYRLLPGGKGANQAIAARLFGADVDFIGKTGRDAYGELLRHELERKGIGTDRLFTDESAPTGLAAITIDGGGENRIVVYPGANMSLCCEDVRHAFLEPYDALLVQFEIPQETVVHLCRDAKKHGVFTVVDAGPAQAFPLESLDGIDVLSPNQTEARALTGITIESESDMRSAAKMLQDRSGAAWVVLKLGKQGSFVYAKGKGRLCKAFEVDAVDPTAAGDAFTAVLTAKYLECKDMDEAVNFGNLAGAIAASRIGAQSSMPSRTEIEEFGAAR